MFALVRRTKENDPRKSLRRKVRTRTDHAFGASLPAS